jgi:hypothetical protein
MVALFGLAGTAHADLDYNFDVSASSPFDAFSFSFVAPDFVNFCGPPFFPACPAFTPFDVTDGTNTWTMTHDLTTNSRLPPPLVCFEFGTADRALSSGCGVQTDPPPPQGSFFLALPAFPTATGIYSVSGLGGFSGHIGSVSLTGTLEISSVPEPTSLGLIGIAVAALGWKLRRNSAKANRLSERRFPSSS